MSVQRKRYIAEEKTRVAIGAIKGQKTLNVLAAEYGVHPSQITQWKKQALEEISRGSWLLWLPWMLPLCELHVSKFVLVA